MDKLSLLGNTASLIGFVISVFQSDLFVNTFSILNMRVN